MVELVRLEERSFDFLYAEGESTVEGGKGDVVNSKSQNDPSVQPWDPASGLRCGNKPRRVDKVIFETRVSQ